MRMVPLGSLTKVTSGGTPSRKKAEYYNNGDIPWVKTGDLKNKHVVEASECITEAALENSSAKLFPKGTVLVALYGATIGECSILDLEAATNQACGAILPTSKVDSTYLYYFFKANQKKLISLGVGGAQPNISGGILKSLQIPLPPLPEQRRIADRLDAADRLRQLDAQVVAKYDELKRSLFLEMFGDPVVNERGWEEGIVRDVCESVKYGTSAKAGAEGRYPYLRMNNIDALGSMDYSKLKYIDASEAEYEKYGVHKGDILFNRTNSAELVGKTGLIDDDKVRILAGYLIRVRVNERARPEFLWAFMNTQRVKARLRLMCKSIVGMANINAKELQTIPMYIPPMEKQGKYADRLSAINRLQSLARASAGCGEEVFGGILGEVFRQS